MPGKKKFVVSPQCRNLYSHGVLVNYLKNELIFLLLFVQELLFTSIQEGIYEFPEREWGGISDDAKDLIKRLLVKEARQRISAGSVLHHPWIQPGPSTRGLYTPHIIRRYDWSFILLFSSIIF